ncbi:MAG: NifB/NifX family molybdenum-iron cluster-binding protein [Myxococcota bacterium]
MRIAVTSQNFRTITGHAGRARRFLVYEAERGAEPREVERLDLPREQAFHDFHSEGPHPVDTCQVVITGGAGGGLVTRLAARGIAVAITSETEPQRAVRDFLVGTLARVAPTGHGLHTIGGGHHYNEG